jgi:glycosyltransferase involved in cell wall biosynthesis
MARGTPVIVSAAGALPELVEEGRTGYVVPPGDAGALARRLTEVMTAPDGLASVRREARRVAGEKFSIERTVDRFLALYERLLSPAVGSR